MQILSFSVEANYCSLLTNNLAIRTDLSFLGSWVARRCGTWVRVLRSSRVLFVNWAPAAQHFPYRSLCDPNFAVVLYGSILCFLSCSTRVAVQGGDWKNQVLARWMSSWPLAVTPSLQESQAAAPDSPTATRQGDLRCILRLDAGSSPFSGTIENFKPVDTQQQQDCSLVVAARLSVMHLLLQWS